MAAFCTHQRAPLPGGLVVQTHILCAPQISQIFSSRLRLRGAGGAHSMRANTNMTGYTHSIGGDSMTLENTATISLILASCCNSRRWAVSHGHTNPRPSPPRTTPGPSSGSAPTRLRWSRTSSSSPTGSVTRTVSGTTVKPRMATSFVVVNAATGAKRPAFDHASHGPRR